MITWHARALHGLDYDTWMNGRFLDQWADPRVVEGLHATYARYDAADFWRALFGSMDLFGWLAPETAAKLGYSYPAESEQRVTEWVKTCFEEWQNLPPKV
jgi:aminoglycoside 6-adenylyltransferase